MGALAEGSTFAGHLIHGLLGQGGMGTVYRATHLALNRDVALKVIVSELSHDREFRMRFRREMEAAASIQHQNVVPIFHAGEEGGLLFVTMRYVEGTDLRRLLMARERLDPIHAANLVAQVAEGLHAAHRRGLVHRDVKPANVLIEGDDAESDALLTDFGLATAAGGKSEISQPGDFVGTLDYAAPEQVEGNPVDAQTDVYALGCLLFQVVTGRVPFPTDSREATMYAHVKAPPPSVIAVRPGAPELLDAVVHRAMAKDPAARYASAAELGRAALAAVERPGSDRTAAAPRKPAPDPKQRTRRLPEALTGGGTFVGREKELVRLRRRYVVAESGIRQFVVLRGEAGIGKSRLAREFAREVCAEATVLRGRSDAESLVPYQPFITLAQSYFLDQETAAMPAYLEPELSELARFVPALRPHVTAAHDPISEEPATRRFRLFEAVARLLTFIARDRPVVLILDDLHWAETSTALLVSHLVDDPEPAKLLVLGTLREDAQFRSEALVELLLRLHRDPGFERIRLGGLDRAETEELVAGRADRDVTDSFVRRLRRGTDGNPFFIEETLRSLDEVVPEAGGIELERALDRIGVPEGIKEMIGRRLARLSRDTAHILTVASVIGREFRLEILERLLGTSAEEIISALEEAAAAGLVRDVAGEVDRFAFAHALVRETLYEQPSTSRRVRLHYRTAESLEAGGEPSGTNPAELAYHFFESGRLDVAGKAVTYARQAAERANESLAYEEAATHYRRALSALETRTPVDGSRCCEILLGLGSAELRAGDPRARDTFARAADVARHASRPEQLGEAALGFAGRYGEAGIVDREEIALLEEALASLDNQESPLTVKLLARLSEGLHFAAAGERTLTLSHSALELARRVGDSAALIASMESRHAALLHIEHLEERLQLSEQLLALADRIGERELKALGHHLRIYDLLEAADVEGARHEHRELTSLADDLRQPRYRHFAVGWEVVWAQMAGRVGDAERLAREAYELGRQAQARDADTVYAAQLVTLRRREGRLAEFLPTIESYVEQNPALVVWGAVLSLAYLTAGDRERGVAEFERLAQDGFAGVPRDMFWFTAMCVLAEDCALIGDAPRAQRLYELLLPYRDRNVVVTQAAYWGSAERFLGLLATTTRSWDAAAGHFEAALSRNAACGVQPALPIIRRDYAEMMLARRAPGDLNRAADLLGQTLEAAELAGLSQFAELVRARIEDIEYAVAEEHPVTPPTSPGPATTS